VDERSTDYGRFFLKIEVGCKIILAFKLLACHSVVKHRQTLFIVNRSTLRTHAELLGVVVELLVNEVEILFVGVVILLIQVRGHCRKEKGNQFGFDLKNLLFEGEQKMQTFIFACKTVSERLIECRMLNNIDF
jgi:hypothetical protein